VPPVVSALNTLAQPRGPPPAPGTAVDPADPTVLTAADLLATQSLDIARHPKLSPQARRLVADSRPATQVAAERRAALMTDPADPAREIAAAAGTLTGRGAAGRRTDLAGRIEAAVALLERTRSALTEVAEGREGLAATAETEITMHTGTLAAAERKTDRGWEEGVRKATADRAHSAEERRRALAVKAQYDAAAAGLAAAVDAYDALSAALEAAPAGALDLATAAVVAERAADVEARVGEYRDLLIATEPQPEGLPTGVVTGSLPRLPELTELINAELAHRRLAHTVHRGGAGRRSAGRLPARGVAADRRP
jgi:hypothetical protein